MLAVATTIVKALTVGEVAHLLFELIHRTHLGHKTAHGIHKAGNFVVYHIKQQHQQRQDKKNPGQKEERETETPYNFKATVNTEQSIEKLKDKAESYLTKLNEGVKNLQKAQEHYAEANKTLEELTVALSSNNNAQFSIHLINFNKNLIGFKNELKVSSRSIAPPPRQILYIADPANGKNEHGSIQRYNECLESINKCFEEMEKTRQKIFEQFEKGVSAIRKLRSRSSPGVEQLQQDIQRSMRSPVQLSEKMHALLPNNTKLAAACTDIIQVFAEFQQGYKIKQSESFENDPIWTPLLTGDKQIKAGQRIFLHAMNESELKTDRKLKIAQIFLRKFISNDETGKHCESNAKSKSPR
ncbi:hypothetical protein [Rickettsiella endosymbiont of Dermanyssus gallinae]|uniref:hypothetical protein n=1 Tax=Rickettsiella endosymbiont of Dermanyssus gallinae TaxID=2856608 RepID=UPI001C530DF3|nr:hypothetical protein [Rickettsiella endosymbiont of Dermanyssus gallinae]